MSRTSSPSSVGNSSRFARRSAPAKRRPSSADRGGSNVFSVAMCAGPAFSTGNVLTGSSSARLHASTSGNSGIYAPDMAEPLSVAVKRGQIVESVHHVHAVAVQDEKVVAEAGDVGLMTSLRSSAKPIQALPLSRAREDLDEAELAIAAASHFGTPMHIEAVRALLHRTGGSETELECGLQDGRPPEPVFHNCSGKHAGMIAVCRARGWPVPGYRLPDHPLQQELLEEVAMSAGLAADEVATGTDGCGVVCFAVPLERAASAFA